MSDLTVSKRVASEMGAVHHIMQINEFENETIFKNPVDRCYQCKKLLFENIFDFVKEKNLKYVLDGTNVDDHNTYRPGIKALKELGVISPLAKLDISKKEVRVMAKKLGISVASRLSAPCMATRLPYNTDINMEVLPKSIRVRSILKNLVYL